MWESVCGQVGRGVGRQGIQAQFPSTTELQVKEDQVQSFKAVFSN